MVVAGSVFDIAAMGGDAGEGEIDSGILRCTLPEREEVGLGFVKAAGIVAVAQGAGQAELILGVGRIAGERGAESGDGGIVVSGVGVGKTFGIKLASTRLLVGIEAGNKMTHGGEGNRGRKYKDEQDDGRGARNQFGGRPRHISYHDII